MSAKLPYATPPGHMLEVLLAETAHVLSGSFTYACATYLLWPLWQRLVAVADVTDKTMFVAMTCAIHTGLYVLGWFVYCYLGDTKGWFAKHKLPRTQRMIPPPALVSTCVRDALVNQIFKTPILLMVGVNLLAVAPQSTARPSLWQLFLLFVGSVLWNSWGFYIAHRSFHEIPYLYQTFHKKHHTFIGSVSIAAEHAHPVEDLFANSIPTIGFAVVFGVPQPVWFVWLAARLIETYQGHSGYEDCHVLRTLGVFGNTRHHDFHHSVNQGNYGGPMQDYLLGTMGPYMHHTGGRVYV